MDSRSGRRQIAAMTKAQALFVYGTLRDEAVQRALFGRTVSGTLDKLEGYRRITLMLGDEGEEPAGYPALIPAPGAAAISGEILSLSTAELVAADAYEGADYVRVSARTCGGRDVWVYLATLR